MNCFQKFKHSAILRDLGDRLLWYAVIFMVSGGMVFLPALLSAGQDLETPKVLARDDGFTLMSNGVVIDGKRNLMWARADNGTKIDIRQAKEYVAGLTLAGYTDWRIPDIQELETLMRYDSSNDTPPTDGCGGNYEIHPFFQLTCCCPWALQDGGTRPAAYPFIKKVASGSMWHHKSNTLGNRVLAVRDID